jgi:DNA-binding transcriptional regulator YiaG
MTNHEFKSHRKLLALTQEGLAKEMGCSIDAVKSWEQGRRRITGVAETLIKRMVGQALQVNRAIRRISK